MCIDYRIAKVLISRCHSIRLKYQREIGQGGTCIGSLTLEPWDWKKFLLGDLYLLQGPRSGQAKLVEFMVIRLGYRWYYRDNIRLRFNILQWQKQCYIGST